MSSTKTDVFPEYVSATGAPTELLEHPDYRMFSSVRTFRSFMPPNSQKVYFRALEDDSSGRYQKHYFDVGKGALCYRPRTKKRHLSWTEVVHRLRDDESEKMRRNCDSRIGFLKGPDHFLVKAGFTFGQRTVEEGTAHIIRTTDVPIEFYLVRESRNVTVRDKIFPNAEQFKYSKLKLEERGYYRIGPKTTYVLLSTHKCFFALTKVGANDGVPTFCRDPVAEYVATNRHAAATPPRKRKGLLNLDEPPATPHIADARAEEQQPAAPRRPRLEVRRPPLPEESSRGSLHRKKASTVLAPERGKESSRGSLHRKKAVVINPETE